MASSTISSFVDTKRAVLYDLVIEKGTDLSLPINLVDEDDAVISVVGYTAQLQVRPYRDSDTVLFEMSTTNSKINVSTGSVVLEFAQTDFATADWASGVYDLEIQNLAGKRERIMQGTFSIDPEVTR